MRQYPTFLQRLTSILLFAGLVVIAIIAFMAGFLIFVYIIAAFLILGLISQVYLLFKTKRSGNVQSGRFNRGRGRIIEHSKDD